MSVQNLYNFFVTEWNCIKLSYSILHAWEISSLPLVMLIWVTRRHCIQSVCYQNLLLFWWFLYCSGETILPRVFFHVRPSRDTIYLTVKRVSRHRQCVINMHGLLLSNNFSLIRNAILCFHDVFTRVLLNWYPMLFEQGFLWAQASLNFSTCDYFL
jgi:hypothetical protein